MCEDFELLLYASDAFRRVFVGFSSCACNPLRERPSEDASRAHAKHDADAAEHGNPEGCQCECEAEHCRNPCAAGPFRLVVRIPRTRCDVTRCRPRMRRSRIAGGKRAYRAGGGVRSTALPGEIARAGERRSGLWPQAARGCPPGLRGGGINCSWVLQRGS